MKNLFAVLLFAMLQACQQKDNLPVQSFTVSEMQPAPILNFTPPKMPDHEPSEPFDAVLARDTASSHKTMIIKDGTMSIRSKNIAESRKKLDALITLSDAYYATEETAKSENEIQHTLTIRIPATQFEIFLANLDSGQDEIMNREVQARDVTEEFIDLESGIKNKRIYLQRYRELLAKAKTVTEILEIEENIRSLQQQMDSQTGRLRYLNDQVSYSTLHVKLFQELITSQPEKFAHRAMASFQNGWNSTVDFSLDIINLWPVILTVSLFTVLIRLFIRRRASKRIAAPA